MRSAIDELLLMPPPSSSSEPQVEQAQAQAPCTAVPMDAMHKLMPGAAMPPPLTRPVAAARGELIHLQVAIKGAVGVGSKVSASIEGFGEVTVRALTYTNMSLPLPAGNGIGSASLPGLFPDALVPLGGAAADTLGEEHLPAKADGETAPQVFWVTALVPRTATPGTHKGFFFSLFSGAGCTASFSVQVSAFALPQDATQLTGAQFESRDIEAFSPSQVYTPET